MVHISVLTLIGLSGAFYSSPALWFRFAFALTSPGKRRNSYYGYLDWLIPDCLIA
jgi:hypothetical protein